jgi:hypothetical protein
MHNAFANANATQSAKAASSPPKRDFVAIASPNRIPAMGRSRKMLQKATTTA